METKMRNTVLGILKVLLVAAVTLQQEPACAHSVRRVARIHHHTTQQLRDAFGSWSPTDQSSYSNYSEHHGLAAAATGEGKSCDVIWCYKN
jgi:hypothetical protein